MPISRQLAATAVAGVWDLLGDGTIDWHEHDEPQLVYPATGILSVSTPVGTWVVPGGTRAMWIPAKTPHAHRAHGPTQVRTLLVPGTAREWVPAVLWVSPLMRELILRLTAPSTGLDVRRERMLAVLLDELTDERVTPLLIPQPRDTRLRKLVDRLMVEPAGAARLEALAPGLGTSARSLSRLCREELGLTYPQLRTRVRLLHALVLLANGATVSATAHACGWSKPSSFIDAFRRFFGTTPAVYRRTRHR
ncbi:MAG TPA: helix-turn-helix transcriptional regulator [Micromonosporaceae bacterium]|nr:helix-turn-helix transcriptional regulator [Micromonosporaceae bacterium]